MDTAEREEDSPGLDPSTRERRRGAILGVAIGDALGAAVEFQPAGSFPEVTGYRGGGPHGLEPVVLPNGVPAWPARTRSSRSSPG